MKAALACIACAGAFALAGPAIGQTYPNKPLRIITAQAGGGSDYATRAIAAPLSVALGQQVIVDNRGVQAADVASKAAPDGYSMLLTGPTLWLLPLMRNNVNTTVDDFTPITTATRTANLLVVPPGLPAKSVAELIALAKAQPGKLNFATSGTGNSVHIAGELFKSMAGIDIVRVNYRGASQALADLIAGRVELMFAVPGSSLPHVKAGRLRALGVTSAEPSPLAPGLPTVASSLPGFESASYLSIFAPAGTPPALIKRLNQEIVRVLDMPDVKQRFHARGIETVSSTPEALAAMVKHDLVTIGKLIKAAGIRAD